MFSIKKINTGAHGKTRYYCVTNADGETVVRFNSPVIAAATVRYLTGGNMSADDQDAVLSALADCDTAQRGKTTSNPTKDLNTQQNGGDKPC